jgi:hypothetical protein
MQVTRYWEPSKTPGLWKSPKLYQHLMSKHKIKFLQCVPGHCDITGNKKADALANKVPFYHKNYRQGNFRLYCQSRNPKERQEDERPQTGNRNIAETVETFSC